METIAISTAKGPCAHHPAPEPEAPKCACKKLLFPRRTHALIGAWLTAFLAIHIAIGVTGAWPGRFERFASSAHALQQRLPFLEVLALFLPLAVQAGTGVFLLKREGMRYNVKKCNRGGKLRFFTQRVTGIAILAYLALHVGTLHPYGLHLLYRATHAQALTRYAEGGLFQSQAAFASASAAFRTPWTAGQPFSFANIVLMIAALLGILGTIFHTANGAWSGAQVWSLLPSPESKQRWGTVCLVCGVLLAAAGAFAWFSFALSAHAMAIR
jgi:succinate dehydrogenase / fumarate reductase, cytochrome b subunit